jgi:tRNA threonylcarbamoyladenosine biosynthesis protein TsaB
MIQKLLNGSGVNRTDLSGIVLSIGPGSYTGLRVGSAVAKGLCYSLDIPLITLNTLTALAAKYRDGLSNTLLISMLVARKEEVYMQVLDGQMQVINDVTPTIMNESTIEGLDLSNKGRIVVCGNANHILQPFLASFRDIEYYDTLPLADNLAELSYNHFRSGNFADIAYFDLDYIKSPHITKSKKQLLTHRSVKK